MTFRCFKWSSPSFKKSISASICWSNCTKKKETKYNLNNSNQFKINTVSHLPSIMLAARASSFNFSSASFFFSPLCGSFETNCFISRLLTLTFLSLTLCSVTARALLTLSSSSYSMIAYAFLIVITYLEKSIFITFILEKKITLSWSMTTLLILPYWAKCSSKCFWNMSFFRLLTNKLRWASFSLSCLIDSSFLCFLPSKCCLNWSALIRNKIRHVFNLNKSQ